VSESLTIEFDQFRSSWLESVTLGAPSPVELGRRFALKLVTQWMDSSENTADFVYCDSAGDGGIDIALLDTGPDESTMKLKGPGIPGISYKANTAVRSKGRTPF